MRLTLIKLSHTVIWAFFAGCILVLPLAGLKRRFDWALALTAVVLLECVILMANRGRCPLTGMAAKFTEDRTDNFRYLPARLAGSAQQDNLRLPLSCRGTRCRWILAQGIEVIGWTEGTPPSRDVKLRE